MNCRILVFEAENPIFFVSCIGDVESEANKFFSKAIFWPLIKRWKVLVI